MHILLTGATGYIGSAVLDACVRAGHDVAALVREPAKAEVLERRGVRANVGDLGNPAAYGAAAEQAEVVVGPGIVYGGTRGIIADLLKDAGNGLGRVIGEGKNHWPCVYVRDLADVYLRVATHAEAFGVFHANDEADES